MDGPQVRPWWERRQHCSDATAPAGCSVSFVTSLECHSERDPHSGQAVKKCVRLHKRLLHCPGRPPVTDEQQQEMTAYGDDAGRLSPNLDEMSLLGEQAHRRRGVQGQDVGQALEDFLHFAAELETELGGGAVQLDETPAQQLRPRCEAPAEGQQAPQSLLGRLLRRWRPEQGSSSERRWQGLCDDMAKGCQEV